LDLETDPAAPAEDGAATSVAAFGADMDIAPRISFASHQCDIAVIASLIARNAGDAPAEGLTLRLSAEPAVFAPRDWTIDRIEAGAETRIRDRRVSLSGGLLDGLTERMRVDVTLELRRGEVVLARQERTIHALARNEWGGAQAMPELLAAHVMPNDPAVARVLKDASRALEAGGRSGALDGYQQRSRTRVWELLAAVWAATCARRLSYAEPPASFETAGQKVRTPTDIEAQGLATCLDTALLFAAAAEQLGLNAMVVFTRGHAFCGAWLQPQTLSTLTVDDATELRKAVDQNELVVFETTLATGATPATFAKAVAEARRRIAEEREGEFVYALDLKQARGRGIHPLAQQGAVAAPAAPEEAGAVVVETPPDLPGFDLGISDDRPPETPAERIDLWKRKLLDLTKRNRLLNLVASVTAIPIYCPDPAALEDRIADGRRIAIIPPPERRSDDGAPDAQVRLLQTGDDLAVQIASDALERDQIIANVDAKMLERGVLELFRKAKADLQEGGSNTLFLALGSLRWRPLGETARSYRAPLILLPVRLERKSAASKPFLTNHEDDAVFNLTLIEMLRQEFAINLAELAGELPTDEHGVDVRKIWSLVRARVRETPGFEVVEEVTLSTFSFAKYLMWKDLADRTEALKGSPFVRHLIESPREPYRGGASFISPREIDERIDPATLFAPLNADSSQIVAIHASAGDGDFVLEGPPGTGKSETIGNLIAHNLACGRKVLFVSEKMAALGVVHRRLQQRGLGAFCLELHSSKANKRGVLEQLGAAWDSAGEHTVIEWTRKAEALREVRSRLNGLVHALHAPGPAGISPRDAIGRVARWGAVHPVALDWGQDLARPDRVATPQALDALSDCARRLGLAFSQITDEDRAAFAAVGRDDWSYAWTTRATDAARAFTDRLAAMRRTRADFAARAGLDDSDALPTTAALGALARLVPDCAATDVGFALGADGKAALEAARAAIRALTAHRAARQGLPAPTTDAALVSAPLAAWRQARTAAQARRWPFRNGALNKLRREVEAHLGWPQATTTEAALEALAATQTTATDAQRALMELPAGFPARGLDTDVARMTAAIEVGAAARAAVLELAAAGGDLVVLREKLRRLLSEGRDLLEPGMAVPAAARAFLAALGPFLDAFEAFRAETALAGDATLADTERTAAAIAERTARLNFWCGWIAARREAEQSGLAQVVEALESGAVASAAAAEVFRTAYCRWAAPLMVDARPELRGFSAVNHEALISTFRTLDRELSDITADYVRAVLSRSIPRKDAALTPAGLGVLARELQKKMRHKPVRQLVAEMGDSLLALTPCLMMSPLSVAQFLPADQSMFDLVVFDEASQITVPDAIGAIARGKRVIVVGDPKQMPPTSFFDKAASGDEDDGDAQDLESILDEALAARAPHHRLTGHYRSRHESLIAFSNHAYYDASLVTYPSADTRDSAVSLRRVDGVYAKGKSRTNPIEAQALVAALVARLRDPREADKSIGVVTLNSEQQRLIEDLLDGERRADPGLERFFGEDAAEPVFVKNLETVQGDQRDVILISIGYGPTEPGARTMSMNFGPLNRQGGERRLNVAITRATSEVVIFASFGPEMIDLTRTSARAVQELKHYLDFAERGPAALGAAVTAVGGMHGYDSDFELAVAEGMRRRGWDVRTQIGVSKFRVDLGVVHPDAPGMFLAGVECDGATYHSSPSARDRDRVRHIILEQLGWRLLRLWSTDWFLDPAACLDRLDTQLRALLEADRAAPPPDPEPYVEAAPPTAPEPPVKPQFAIVEKPFVGVVPAAGMLETTAIRSAPAGAAALADAGSILVAAPDPGRFYDSEYAPALAAQIAPIIAAEAPIMLRRLARLIARLHGFQRTGKEIVRVVRETSATLGRIAPSADGEDVIWALEVEPASAIPYRGLDLGGEARPWSEVPHPEKIGFARDFLDHPDAVRAMAERLKLGRLTGPTRDEFETLLAAAQEVQA
jgi:very-short-patch-repair endonuclease